MFPYHVPGHTSFLGVDPVSHTRLRLPEGADADKIQAEPEVAGIGGWVWGDTGVEAVRPEGFTAYNDASIRRAADKISHKKNWGAHTKGLAAEVVPLSSLEPGCALDRYHLASFLVRDGRVMDYGEDSPVRSYAYFHGRLLTWIADRLNHQQDHGPLEHLAALLEGRPERAVIGIGATRYCPAAVTDRLRPGDEVVVAVYDAAAHSLDAVRDAVATGSPLPPGNPLLRQRVEGELDDQSVSAPAGA